MSGLSTRLKALTSTLVTKYGAEVIVSRVTSPTFDVTTQTKSGGTTLTDTVAAVIDEYSSHEIGDTIQYGDKKLTIPSLDFTNLSAPQPDDIIEINSEKYRVISSQGISAGDDFVGYQVQIRK